MKLESEPFKSEIAFEDIFKGPKFERLKRSLLTILLRQKDRVFKNETGPDGEHWKPLSTFTEAMRNEKITKKGFEKLEASDGALSAHKILQDTGMLRNSLTDATAPYSAAGTEGDEVKIGTSVDYAATHNFGAIIVPRQAASLSFVGAGGVRVFTKKSVIPARPFIGFGESDSKKVNEKIEAYMNKGGAE